MLERDRQRIVHGHRHGQAQGQAQGQAHHWQGPSSSNASPGSNRSSVDSRHHPSSPRAFFHADGEQQQQHQHQHQQQRPPGFFSRPSSVSSHSSSLTVSPSRPSDSDHGPSSPSSSRRGPFHFPFKRSNAGSHQSFSSLFSVSIRDPRRNSRSSNTSSIDSAGATIDSLSRYDGTGPLPPHLNAPTDGSRTRPRRSNSIRSAASSVPTIREDSVLDTRASFSRSQYSLPVGNYAPDPCPPLPAGSQDSLSPSQRSPSARSVPLHAGPRMWHRPSDSSSDPKGRRKHEQQQSMDAYGAHYHQPERSSSRQEADLFDSKAAALLGIDVGSLRSETRESRRRAAATLVGQQPPPPPPPQPPLAAPSRSGTLSSASGSSYASSAWSHSHSHRSSNATTFSGLSSGGRQSGGNPSKIDRLMGADVSGAMAASADHPFGGARPPHPPTSSARGHTLSPIPSVQASLSFRGGADVLSPTGFGPPNVRPDAHSSSALVSPSTSILDEDCPVCLEPLSYRLAGEKPHVVPSCGHALHEACFTAVYGPVRDLLPPPPGSSGMGRKRKESPGMCGVCRRPISFGDGEEDKGHSKFAAIAGVNDEIPDGRPSGSLSRLRQSTGMRPGPSDNFSLHGPLEDDPIETASMHSRGSGGHARRDSVSLSGGLVTPFIKARSEFATLRRKTPLGSPGNGDSGGSKQHLTCIVTVEVIGRRPPPVSEMASMTPLGPVPDEEDDMDDDHLEPPIRHHAAAASSDESEKSKDEEGSQPSSPDPGTGFSFGATPSVDTTFTFVLDDLRMRITDWKGHSLEHFGTLKLYDLISVRQESIVRDFYVYLFQEALLCVTEEKKKGLSRFIAVAAGGATAAVADSSEPSGGAGGGGGGSSSSGLSPGGRSTSSKPPLKLKGRIYLRHIRRVIDSTVAGEYSLTITMEDESLDHFILCFKEPAVMQAWKKELVSLIDASRPGKNASGMLSVTGSENNSCLSPSSAASGGGNEMQQAQAQAQAQQAHLHDLASPTSSAGGGSKSSSTSPRTGGEAQQRPRNASGSLPTGPPPVMLPHNPLDLVLVFSVPNTPAGGQVSSSAALKLRLIKSTLEFVLYSLGPRDRLSIITFTVGVQGRVRRTPLLLPSREIGRARLQAFVDSIGRPYDATDPEEQQAQDELRSLGGGSDRTDVVTAVNVALDIVLQRKTKNAVTGIILVNDAADGARRGQMDLVLARCEAAHTPIHSFGYGKTHDPSSLWLISNHTKGTYTFVREWYHLRQCLAGCIGGLMSVAITDVKIHIGMPDRNHFKVRKVSGPTGAIVSSDGKDVDAELGEMRFGDRREMLVELEFDFDRISPPPPPPGSPGAVSARNGNGHAGSASNATDEFVQRLGLQGLSLTDGDVWEGIYEGMIDEVPVFEVDASYRDPALGKVVTRLPYPILLTVEVDSTAPASDAPQPPLMSDPLIVRRRMELLVSDMITRSLLLVSRRNYPQALRIFTETRRILETVMASIPDPKTSKDGTTTEGGLVRKSSASSSRRQREVLNARTLESLSALLDDINALVEGLEEEPMRTHFDRDHRNFGAQQAMVLRDQKAWTARTPTERMFFTADNAGSLVDLAAFAPQER